MSEQRFYELKDYHCPRCWRTLSWRNYENRPDRADSLVLFHGGEDGCKNQGKYFYPPVVNLTEVPEEMR